MTLKLVLALVAVVAVAVAQETTPLPTYSLPKAQSPANNAGNTLEMYINANADACLKEVVANLKQKDGTTAWDAAHGTKFIGVYDPMAPAVCGTDTPEADAKACATPDPVAPKGCAYTDAYKAACIAIDPACYKAWQEEAPPADTTTAAPAEATTAAAGATTAAAGATTAAAAASDATTVAAAADATTAAAAGATTSASHFVQSHLNQTVAPAGASTAAPASSQQPAIVIKFVPVSAAAAGSGAPASGGAAAGGQQPAAGDSHKWCPFWASKGECEKNPFWMKDNCKASCAAAPAGGASSGGSSGSGSSSGSAGGACADEHELCNFWASKQECDKNSPYMHLKCKKACSKC